MGVLLVCSWLLASLFVVHTSLPVSFAQVNCLDEPSNAACMSYMYPDANSTADMNSLCMMMDFMSGCTIRNICSENHDYHSDPYCEAFSLLADACASDMPDMGGCGSYVALCSPADSVVHQCDMYPPIPGLPTTSQANEAIKSLCVQHYMAGCEKCVDNGGYMDCDLLSVYSEICLGMPDMADCAQWNVMCEAIPTWSELCPSTVVDQPPIMKMYFHTGIVDYILFQSWVPRTDGQYAAAVIGIILLGIIFEGLQSFRALMEFKWKYPSPQSVSEGEIEPLNGNQLTLSFGGPFQLWLDLQRAVIYVAEVFIGYCLMLIAMTFNVGLFLAVLAGLFVGHFTFGRFRGFTAKRACH